MRDATLRAGDVIMTVGGVEVSRLPLRLVHVWVRELRDASGSLSRAAPRRADGPRGHGAGNEGRALRLDARIRSWPRTAPEQRGARWSRIVPPRPEKYGDRSLYSSGRDDGSARSMSVFGEIRMTFFEDVQLRRRPIPRRK